MDLPFGLSLIRTKVLKKLKTNSIDLEYENHKLRWLLRDARDDARKAEMRMLIQNDVPKFDDATLRKLIGLCHPDRHGGKQSAQDMTAMLVKMRNASR